jgi:hypothetical protein
MEKSTKSWIIAGATIFALLIGSLLYRAMFFTFVDNYEFAYKFESNTGRMYPLVNPDGSHMQGYIFKWPIIESVHTIDTRPMQVCINANSRVLNCKLVQFDIKGFETFIAWHGRSDYDQSALNNILMSYAYDPSQKQYPFLKVIKELKNQDIEATNTIANDSLQFTINTDSTETK